MCDEETNLGSAVGKTHIYIYVFRDNAFKLFKPRVLLTIVVKFFIIARNVKAFKKMY